MVTSELLNEMAKSEDEDVELLPCAMEIAKIADPDLDAESVISNLEELANAVELKETKDTREQVSSLLTGVYGLLGFKGNAENYYDPKNSLVDQVVETRLGIPISLALVLIEIGKRKGVELEGIGFPGHFLVTLAQDHSILIDPFVGSILEDYKREELIAHASRDYDQSEDESLEIVSNKAFVARMASNLKHIYMLNEHYEDAHELCNIILMFAPQSAGTWRDRGLVRAKLQHFQGAKVDLEKYLELAPDDRFAPAIRAHVERLEKRINLFH